MIYTEHEILVSKIFKGEKRSNNVILITPGGIAEGQFMYGSHTLDLEEDLEGIFFAGNQLFGGIVASELKDNTCFANKMGSYFPKHFIESTIPLGYGALESKKNYEQFLTVIGNPIYEFTNEAEANIFPFDCSRLTSGTQAEISFGNFEISENFGNIEFDIMIKTNPEGLKLGKCEYLIDFPDSIFGSYPIQNNTVVISKGNLINNSNDYLLSTVDEASNKIKVGIQFTGTSNNEAVLQDEEVQLLHCTFAIPNPSLLSEVATTDFRMEGDVWFECKGRLVPFDNVFFKPDLEVVIPTFGAAGIDFHLQKFSFRTQGALQLISFDIYASSTESTILNTAELYINYGSSAFGTFLETNGLTAISGPNGYVSSLSDQAASVLKLELTESFPNTPPLTVGTEPVKLASITLGVQDCTEIAGISWSSLTNNINQTYQDGSDIFQYSSISFSGELNLPMCGCNQPNDPEITGFSESQVRAGVGERLTIYGDNFGEVIVKGSCYIEVDK